MANIPWALLLRFTNLAPFWLVVYIFQLVVPGVLYVDPNYSVIISWVFLQCILVTFIVRQFKGVPWNKVEDIDFALAVLVGSAFVVFSASVAVDLLPVNYVARIHHMTNVLSPFECDSIIKIAERHANLNLEKMVGSSRDAEGASDKLKAMIASGGWLTDRHANYPTTDISAYSIKQNTTLLLEIASSSNSADDKHYDFVSWMNHTIEHRVLPQLKRQYNLPDIPGLRSQLSMKDLFIVKYDADNPLAQKHLELHIDSSQLSFNIALNEHDSSIDHQHSNEGSIDTYSGGGTYFMRSEDTVHIHKGDMLSHPSRIYHAGSEVTKGKRYILVGFVTVRPYGLSAYYKRFGMFSRCVGVVQETAAPDGGVEAPSMITAKCQNYLWVYAYELWTVLKDPFLKASTNRKSFILAAVLSFTAFALVMAVFSVVALYWSGSGTDEDISGSDRTSSGSAGGTCGGGGGGGGGGGRYSGTAFVEDSVGADLTSRRAAAVNSVSSGGSVAAVSAAASDISADEGNKKKK